MKMKYFLYLIIIVILISCQSEPQLVLVQDEMVQAEIVLDTSADSLSRNAAILLKDYLFRMNNHPINISSAPTENLHHVYIGKKYLPSAQRNRLEESEFDDSFIIWTENDNLYLAGKKPQADIYAVCALLEDYLGCMKFSPQEEFVPVKARIAVPEIKRVYSPAFPFRVPHFTGRYDQAFRDWHRISSFDDWGMFVHTFHRLISPEKYFKKHPEFFALVNGRRLQDGQLCLSNRELMAELIHNLGKEIKKRPERTYWSVSQNDCYNYCECEGCNELYEKYGAFSGAYIEMSNEIAQKFPDKQISTLAYQFTRSAPKNIKPLQNVNIMFCSIECNRSQPLADDPRSADFVKDMQDWSRLSDNIFAWDYVVQFKNYLTPFPNFHVLQPNIQFFRENNVNMMFQQGSGGSWSDLSDVKQYLIAKLLWNPDANADSIITRFMDTYYGPASDYIKEYYRLTHQHLIEKQKTQVLDIYGFPVFYYKAHLTPELLVKYQELMDEAQKAVSDDNTYYNRVLKTRIPADFAYLDIGHNTSNALVKWTIDADGHKKINPEMVAKLDRFVENCKLTGVKNINERSLRPENYRDFVMRKLQWQIKDNKLYGAEIELVTKDSPKYPVGGARALNDKLMGGLDFRFNWLGFEDEHMIIRIDLKKEKEFSNIRMNFLKAVNSWVFLPTDLKIEVSKDGKNYRKVASVQGDNSDRSFLVKSIPFTLDFENIKARYIQITAFSMKTCPAWHRGYGQPAWIFTDEIVLE